MLLDLNDVAAAVGLVADALAILALAWESVGLALRENRRGDREGPSDGPYGRHFAEKRREEGDESK